MNWLDLYKPKFLKDINSNKDAIKESIKWIEDYKKDYINTEKVLLIIGGTGHGKTLLAELLFSEFNYKKIELNSSDTRSQKKISEFLKKSLTYKNVIDMFFEGNQPVGILMDEIDSICKLNDKGGMAEFINILKLNEKHQDICNHKLEKKRGKKKNIEISVSDYIQLYNPIICCTNDVTDKKITELKKYSRVIHLKKPSKEELIAVINDVCNQSGLKIEEKIKAEIIEYSGYDIRKLIIFLEGLFYSFNGDKIKNNLFYQFKNIYKEKEEEYQLIDSTKLLMSKKLEIKNSQIFFDVDCLLVPLMLYHNSLEYIKNCGEDNKTKINIYKNIMDSICMHDIVQTNIFEFQEWNELYDLASFYGASMPNFYFNKLKTKKNEINIEFTNLLNKISQLFTTKKLLMNAKYSMGKANYDMDEVIYIFEILLEYFNSFKEEFNDDNCSESEDEEDSGINNDFNIPKNLALPIEYIHSSELKNGIVNNNIFKKEDKSDLIMFMKKYNITTDELENIFKIEKLNKLSDKKKKKFTLKIKKELNIFL
jgi:DNA polymerase III delta prime subunit